MFQQINLWKAPFILHNCWFSPHDLFIFSPSFKTCSGIWSGFSVGKKVNLFPRCGEVEGVSNPASALVSKGLSEPQEWWGRRQGKRRGWDHSSQSVLTEAVVKSCGPLGTKLNGKVFLKSPCGSRWIGSLLGTCVYNFSDSRTGGLRRVGSQGPVPGFGWQSRKNPFEATS